MRVFAKVACCAIALLAFSAPANAADFGLSEFDVTFTGSGGEPVTQAGSHPFAMTTKLKLNTEDTPEGTFPVESTKDLLVTLAPGLAGNQEAASRCSTLDFLVVREPVKPGGFGTPSCADSAAVGTVNVELGTVSGLASFPAPLYNLEPPPGKVARLGFIVESVPISVDVELNQHPPYNLVAVASNVSQALEVYGAELKIWGVPGDPAHDEERGRCFEGGISCPAEMDPLPLLTMPRSCTGPIETRYAIDSWQRPGLFVTGGVLSHDDAIPPNPLDLSGCDELGFSPETDAQPSTAQAESAAGLDFTIDVEDEGLTDPEGIADADITSLRAVFPPGMTLNPSAAEGLGACTKAQYEAASLMAQGCPNDSKVGTIEVDTPLLESHVLHGAVFVAQPNDPATAEHGAENPFDSLLALYLVIRDPELGVFIALPAEVKSDKDTGQLVTTVDGLPPFPLGHVDVHLRSGPRAPLVTPPTCGTYSTTATLTPSSGAAPLVETSSFEITSGPGGGPCPPVAAPPFDPGFSAGSLANTAGAYSPFLMRLTRADGEQDITRIAAALPAGVVPKLAGVAKCGEAEIAAARGRSGRAELAGPSCPSGSQIGTVVGGAGVGADLTYVRGQVYLAGPYNGDPLSAVAIVPAVAGPFDLGTVVTRVALRLNPITYVGEIDGSASDPIPHILEGIPLKLRDLRIHADRPGFTLTPTSCAVESTQAQIFGGFLDSLSSGDDVSVQRSSRYQAAGCASLRFRPKLAIRFTGGRKRASHPALHARIAFPAGSGYANIGRAVVTLPPSEFIDQAHISTPCTRPQFAAGTCPPGSILGRAKASTPLLDEPLEGLVYFRSNGGERLLPDVVVDLRGLVHVTLVGQVDTRLHKGVGRLRTTFAQVPDAPISSFTLDLKGGKKGLLVNSRNLCGHPLRYESRLTGQNGRHYVTRPLLRVAGCRKRHR